MHVLISGNDTYRLDSTSHQIDISKITNVARIQMTCQNNIKYNCEVVLTTGKPSITRHSNGTEMTAPKMENICTLAVI
jgi:hypothetical protein